jgi:hypothetical protein
MAAARQDPVNKSAAGIFSAIRGDLSVEHDDADKRKKDPRQRTPQSCSSRQRSSDPSNVSAWRSYRQSSGFLWLRY